MLTLMQHQKEALEHTANFTRCAYFHAMGLGKTFTGGEKLASFNATCNLIVCQKSKVTDWVLHMQTYYGASMPVYSLLNGVTYQQFLSSAERRVGVINYDILARRPDLAKLENIAVVFDESSMLKNERAQRTKAALKLKIRYCVLLSGTPVGGKYEELWTQCRLLGWQITKDDFWKKFIWWREWQPAPRARAIKLVTGYHNVDLLKLELARHGAHFLKTEEVLTLPDQVFQTIHIKPSLPYKRFMQDGVATVENEQLVASTPLTKLLYARELCSIYNKDKHAAFVDLLNSTNERVIVFYNFVAELYALRELAKDRPQSFVNGQIKDLAAYENCSNSITFVQYQSGAMGLNLQKANRIVYHSLPLSSELFEQSKKRIHRIGQKQTCFYYYLLCDDTIEVQILSALKRRNDYTLELFEHDWY